MVRQKNALSNLSAHHTREPRAHLAFGVTSIAGPVAVFMGKVLVVAALSVSASAAAGTEYAGGHCSKCDANSGAECSEYNA